MSKTKEDLKREMDDYICNEEGLTIVDYSKYRIHILGYKVAVITGLVLLSSIIAAMIILSKQNLELTKEVTRLTLLVGK